MVIYSLKVPRKLMVWANTTFINKKEMSAFSHLSGYHLLLWSFLGPTLPSIYKLELKTHEAPERKGTQRLVSSCLSSLKNSMNMLHGRPRTIITHTFIEELCSSRSNLIDEMSPGQIPFSEGTHEV